MAATNKARSLSSSSRALNFTANWNLGSIMSLKGRRKLLRNSRVMKPRPCATSSPSLFMQEASRAKIASCTPYFSKVTWSFRWSSGKPGTALANSVSSVTVSTDVRWLQWKSRPSASRCRRLAASTLPPNSWISNVFSASCRVCKSWMTKGFQKKKKKRIRIMKWETRLFKFMRL